MSHRLKRFSFVSLIGALILISALILFFRFLNANNLTYHNNRHNSILAQLFKNSLMQHGLSELLVSNETSAPVEIEKSELAKQSSSVKQQTHLSESKYSHGEIIFALDQQIVKHLQDLPVLKLKIYDRTGTVVYSSVYHDMGQRAESLDIFLRTNKGEIVNRTKYREKFQLEQQTLNDIYVLESYVPIRMADGEIYGVFEIYSDVSDSIKQGHVMERRMIVGVIFLLGASYGILFFIFYSTDRKLRQEEADRRVYLNEIEQINDDLEIRVKKRTEDIESARYFLQSIIDGIADPVMVIGMDLKVIEMNQANRDLIPKNKAAKNYQYCYQISHRLNTPCSGKDHPCAFKIVLETGSTCKVLHTHYNDREEPIFVEVTSTPLKDINGELLGIIEVAHDVTDVIQAKNQLQESQQCIRAVMDTVNSGILTVSESGLIRDSNLAAEKIFNITQNQIIGAQIDSLLGSAIGLDADGTEGQITTHLDPMVLQNSREIIITRSDGGQLPVELWVGQVDVDVVGEKLNIIVLQNISKRKQAEKELAQTHQQYFHTEKMAAIGQLAAGILHEVGNPIASISGALEAIDAIHANDNCKIKTCKIKDDVMDYVTMIEQQINRLSGITREIADFASPNVGEFELLDINGLIHKTLNLMRYDKRVKKLQLKQELSLSLPAVTGVIDQLTQIFMNLVVNAVDACEAASDRTSKINIKTILEDEQIVVMVEDNGSGMDPDILKHSREAFFTTKPVGKGTGLGLPLCDTLMIKHKGSLKIDTQPGRGTVVSLYFPVNF